MKRTNENMIYTQGYIEDGCIVVPAVFLEEGVSVELAIKAVAGKFEVAMFPSQESEECSDICDGNCDSCPFHDKGEIDDE